MLVDDEPALRELLRATFESADVAVDEAGSAREAEDHVRLRRPDVIVLDLRMPGEDGSDLCARLKAAAATSDIPVVLLTGADGDTSAAAKACGADALVHKPFSPLELVAVVNRVTGRSQSPLSRPRSAPTTHEELILYARDLRHLLEVERRQRELLQQSYLGAVAALATALETKDTGTSTHSQRVQRYALELLEVVDPQMLDCDPGIGYGFLLHDIGKIGIPDEILQKAGPLTPSERDRMQDHTVLGEEMLRGIALLHGEGLKVVRSHHERWDGRGYPDSLRGDEIPLGARVFAVADALDAITSDRPYRRGRSWEAAREEIAAQAGRQFDPEVAEAFAQRERVLRAINVRVPRAATA